MRSIRHLPIVLLSAALMMLFPLSASAGCGSSCDFISCVPDDPSIGCVENFGFCWEVPCFAPAEAGGCQVNETLTALFASWGDELSGEEVLEKLRSDEELAEKVLPFIRVVGQNGEVFQGDKFQKAPMAQLAETSTKGKATEAKVAEER